MVGGDGNRNLPNLFALICFQLENAFDMFVFCAATHRNSRFAHCHHFNFEFPVGFK